ncbi:proton-conducting transporter membrane subunit [Escherichia coli]
MGIVGAVTLLLPVLPRRHTLIKRVLAYSTMSQIGYMFLALGVQAWDAAIFHLMTHAFFKALLFLASVPRHSGLPSRTTPSRWAVVQIYSAGLSCFLVGGAALSARPRATAASSVDEILARDGEWSYQFDGGRSGRCVYDLALHLPVRISSSSTEKKESTLTP